MVVVAAAVVVQSPYVMAQKRLGENHMHTWDIHTQSRDTTLGGTWALCQCCQLLLASSALTSLVEHQEKHVACRKLTDEVLAWHGYLSGVRKKAASREQ